MTAARGRIGVTCALLAAMLAAGCSAGPVTSYRPSEQTCYDLAVQALQRHVALSAHPPACAGLSAAVVNMAVARAIKEVTGPWPKAIARQWMKPLVNLTSFSRTDEDMKKLLNIVTMLHGRRYK